MGMVAENELRKIDDQPPAYTEVAFNELIERCELRPDIVRNFLVQN